MVSNKLLVDLAFEYCTEQELSDVSETVINRLSGLRNVYKLKGNGSS
jgi:hypothetical protein